MIFLHRIRTGKVTLSRTSLSAVSNLAQISFAYDYVGRVPFNEPAGRGVLGYNARSHFYQVGKGWLYLDSKTAELEKLEKVAGLKGASRAGDVAAFLEECFWKAPAAYWAERPQGVDIAAAVPNSIEQPRC